jgi:hypothetical protein
MTERARLKKIVRARMERTGEQYLVARRAVLDEEMANEKVRSKNAVPLNRVICPRCAERWMNAGARQCFSCSSFDLQRTMGTL